MCSTFFVSRYSSDRAKSYCNIAFAKNGIMCQCWYMRMCMYATRMNISYAFSLYPFINCLDADRFIFGFYLLPVMPCSLETSGSSRKPASFEYWQVFYSVARSRSLFIWNAMKCSELFLVLAIHTAFQMKLDLIL